MEGMAVSHAKSIYLAGPITGLSYGEARHGWRERFAEIMTRLEATDIALFSPMRAKHHLSDVENLDGNTAAYSEGPAISSASGIVCRDRNDVKNCGVVVANLLGAEIVSIGTVMEFAWADAFGTPLIMVIEDEGNIHEHLMMEDVAGYRVNNLEEAAFLAKWLLTPGI